jgi:hypothetical protein
VTQEAAATAYLVIQLVEPLAAHEHYLRQRPHEYQAQTQALFALGAPWTGQHYVRAQRIRAINIRQWMKIFRNVDAVLTPTTPRPAPAKEEGEATGVFDLVNYTSLFDFNGCPSISVPGRLYGRRPSGRPHALGAAVQRGHVVGARPRLSGGDRVQPASPEARLAAIAGQEGPGLPDPRDGLTPAEDGDHFHRDISDRPPVVRHLEVLGSYLVQNPRELRRLCQVLREHGSGISAAQSSGDRAGGRRHSNDRQADRPNRVVKPIDQLTIENCPRQHEAPGSCGLEVRPDRREIGQDQLVDRDRAAARRTHPAQPVEVDDCGRLLPVGQELPDVRWFR